MKFYEGDTVMHWTHGLGQILRLEERDLSGVTTLYYAVQIRDMTVWVPSDGELEYRLRAPTSISGFKKLIAILSNPCEPLPDDRQERKTLLLGYLRDGRTQSLFQIIRGLHAYRKIRPLNEYDQSILRQARNSLLGEWGFVLSISSVQAEHELNHWLMSEPANIINE
jgi:RNA polymerase-interacting CarD/CdnL/TRCF family regulator